jgi:hypothetical protein
MHIGKNRRLVAALFVTALTAFGGRGAGKQSKRRARLGE